MDSRFLTGQINPSPVRKWVVAFLLIFGCADIVSPQLCDEDLEVATHFASSAPVRAAGPDYSKPSIGVANPTGAVPEKPLQHSPADDDCFCCCTHLLPGHFFEGTQLLVASPRNDLKLTALPSSPSHAPFHPPRLS
jgi:hypothetical protein